MTRHRWQTGGILLASALLLSACGSSGASGSYAVPEATKDAAYYADYDYDTAAEESYAGDYDGLAMNQTANAGTEAGSGLTEAEMNRKLVKTVNLDCETEDIDSFEAKLMQRVREAGGYVEASNRWGRISTEGSGRHGSYTLRIPVEHLDALVSSIRGETNVLTQSSDISDITLQYVDTESRIKALRIEQEQLLGMLEKAESVEDMITIQSRLSEVNASLQNYESSRKLMDNQVNYATIYLNIDEVVKYTPVEEKGALTRMKEGFIDSCAGVAKGLREFAVWFVVHLPYIVVWVLIIVLIVLAVRGMIRRSRRKWQEKAEKNKDKKRTGAYYQGLSAAQYGLSGASPASPGADKAAEETAQPQTESGGAAGEAPASEDDAGSGS